jgi:hypothetical protein
MEESKTKQLAKVKAYMKMASKLYNLKVNGPYMPLSKQEKKCCEMAERSKPSSPSGGGKSSESTSIWSRARRSTVFLDLHKNQENRKLVIQVDVAACPQSRYHSGRRQHEWAHPQVHLGQSAVDAIASGRKNAIGRRRMSWRPLPSTARRRTGNPV